MDAQTETANTPVVDPTVEEPRWTLLRGDCYDVLKTMADNSIDAVVTDPPYGLSNDVDIRRVIRHWFVGKEYKHDGTGYMGAEWDSFVPGPEIWKEVHRVLKPGGHLFAFTGSRTMDLMGFAIRFGGFEARDTILAWVYGVSKAKGLDISKGIDNAAGAEREVVEYRKIKRRGYHIATLDDEIGIDANVTKPATEEAKRWDGWHTGLKPGFEPVLVFRKALEGTAVENVLKYGTGGYHVDAVRVDTRPEMADADDVKGYFPTNVLIAHHPACIEGEQCSPECAVTELNRQYDDGIRFFPQFWYNGKATKEDRFAYVECGCDLAQVMPLEEAEKLVTVQPVWQPHHGEKDIRCEKCDKPYTYERHPTVKPTSVMQWLVRLVAQPNALILDPFNGSGSTGVAVLKEGFRYVGIEREEKFYRIASARLSHAANEPMEVREARAKAARVIPKPTPSPEISPELKAALFPTETPKPTLQGFAKLDADAFKKALKKGSRR